MKKLIWIAGSVLAVILVLAFLLPGGAPKPSPWIAFPDGSSSRIVAVTYGTNHLIGSPLGRLFSRLPDALQDNLPLPDFHRTTTSESAMIIWLEHRNAPKGQALSAPGGQLYECLADGTGGVSGAHSVSTGYFGSLGINTAEFTAIPRRDPNLILNFYSRTAGGVTNLGTLQYPNPLYAHYGEWQAEKLPSTKKSGNVEVTLAGIRTGYSTANSIGFRPGPGRGAGIVYSTNHSDGEMATVLDLQIRPLTDTNQKWGAKSVEISDATGNHLSADVNPPNIEGTTTWKFYPSLWLSEKVWKLKLEIGQAGNFGPESLVTFSNVPLGTTLGLSTNFNGVTISLLNFTLKSPLTNQSGFSPFPSPLTVSNSIIPAGTRMDFYRIVFDEGTTNTASAIARSPTFQDIELDHVPLAAKRADITFVVQSTRIIEFLVHPEPPSKE